MGHEILGIKKLVKPQPAPESLETETKSEKKAETKANEVKSPGKEKINLPQSLLPKKPDNLYKKRTEKTYQGEGSTSDRADGEEVGNRSEKFERPEKFDRPRRVEIKQDILAEASNISGQVFQVGNKILVQSPWHQVVTAEITGFYKSPHAQAVFAEFTPVESLPDWSWDKGCMKVELLTLAS